MTVTVDGLEVADPADGWMRAGFSVDSDAVCPHRRRWQSATGTWPRHRHRRGHRRDRFALRWPHITGQGSGAARAPDHHAPASRARDVGPVGDDLGAARHRWGHVISMGSRVAEPTARRSAYPRRMTDPTGPRPVPRRRLPHPRGSARGSRWAPRPSRRRADGCASAPAAQV